MGWKALEGVHLKEKVENIPEKLYADMAEYGSHFNTGERQLLALARLLMKNAKIIVFEESPSILFQRTEAILHHVLSSRFKHCTVIVIAQRVQSVIDKDRVMVLDEGKIKEFDPPHMLLQTKTGYFYQMVNSLPPKEVSVLKQKAQDKYENHPYVPPPMSLGGETVYTGRGSAKNFLPSFQSNRLTGVLSHFTGNRFSTNRF